MIPDQLAAHPRVREALDPFMGAFDNIARERLLSEVLAVYHESLAGEGLDFEVAEVAAEMATATGLDYQEEFYGHLNAQHRARVTGLETRVKELEENQRYIRKNALDIMSAHVKGPPSIARICAAAIFHLTEAP